MSPKRITGEVPQAPTEETPTEEPKDELAERREKDERTKLTREIADLIRGM